MSLETDVQVLTQATTDLLSAVNVKKSTLDQSVNDAAAQVSLATTQATNAAASAATATTKAGEAAGSAASALAIYGNTAAQQAAVTAAQNAASVAAGHAASASSVVQQDLSGVNAAALHRSPNAVTAMFVYDTSKDSDGGAWTEKCQHTSWYNEAINGKWLGAQASEAAARAVSGATTGDYFQLTTDGKFYKLNATSGTTEVFRGNKRDFPRLAGIVAEAANVTIYDLTEPGRPMWMRFAKSTSNNIHTFAGYGNTSQPITSTAMINGLLCIGNNNGGLNVTSMILDNGQHYSNTAAGRFSYNNFVSNRNLPQTATTTIGAGLASSSINSVAATVLPDAPINPATGIKVPTIAAATGSGVSVIKHDGTVANSSTTSAIDKIAFNRNDIWFGSTNIANLFVVNYPIYLNAGWSNQTISNGVPGNSRALALASRSDLIRSSTNASTVQRLKSYESSLTRGVLSTITNLFNTGHQVGDIRRTYLSDIGAGSVTNPSTVADRSYKAATASVTGTITKSAVASAAQLVAYSGFSASNYLREPSFSADLDFGTGEWTASAWVNVPVSFSTEIPVNLTNGTFDSDLNGWTATNGAVWDSSQRALLPTVNASISQAVSTTPGKTYKVTFSRQGWEPALLIVEGVQYSVGGSTSSQVSGSQTFVAVNSSTTLQIKPSGSTPTYIDNVSVVQVVDIVLVSREYSSGPSIKIALTSSGAIQAVAHDGTTTRTVTSSAAYNTATWLKVSANYTTDGSLALLVNGQEVAVTRGAPLQTLNNANAVLTIGNSYAADAPFPGSLALVKFSATVPTAEQSVWMYEQEKQMFRDGAQCCLPDSGSIVDLTYDDATDKWIAVSATNESEWSGLVRTSVTPVPAGSYTKASAASGIQLLARSTTSPGVDITIPAYGLREELVKRAESAARLARSLVPFDYVGGFTASTTNGSTSITSVAGLSYPTSYIGARVSGSGIPADTVIVAVSGTTIYLSKAATATATGVQISFTDFILPVGYEAKDVLLAGVSQKEGATAAFTRQFDGFKETIRFGTAPAYNANVSIQAARSIQ